MKRVPSFVVEPIAALASLTGYVLGKDPEGSGARARGRLLARDQRVSIGPRCNFLGRSRIELADRVTFFGNAYLNALSERGFIKVGRNTHIDQFCVLYGHGGLTIGSDCAIASGVIIYTQTNQYKSDFEAKIVDQPVIHKPVVIGNDVWIGAGAVILPGVQIGDHAVIAACALVRQDVASWSIVGGVPAKVIGDRGPKLPSVTDQVVNVQ